MYVENQCSEVLNAGSIGIVTTLLGAGHPTGPVSPVLSHGSGHRSVPSKTEARGGFQPATLKQQLSLQFPVLFLLG